jgi:hypothetical protein
VAFYAIAFGDGHFAAADARGITFYSPDGMIWSNRFTVTGGAYLFGLTFAQGIFVGVGGPYSGGSQKIATSSDGIEWRLRATSITNSAALQAVTYGNGYFVAVGDKGTIMQSDPVFTLSLSWTPNGLPRLVLDGESGRAYRIQTRNNLVGSNWTDVSAVTNATEMQSYIDTQTLLTPVRFYRGVLP